MRTFSSQVRRIFEILAAKTLNVNSPFLRGPKITNLSLIRKKLALKPLFVFLSNKLTVRIFISGLFMVEAKSMLPVPIKANKGRQ